MEPPTIIGTNLRTAFVLLLVVAVTALFLAVAWPFLKPLLLAALLAGLFHPLYRWITRLLGGRQSLGAAVTLLVLFVLGLGPVSAFLGIVLQQALTMSDQAIPWLSQHLGAASAFNVHDWLVQRFPALAKYVPSQEQLLQHLGTATKTAGAFLVTTASRMTATTAAFLLNLFVMFYAMFFFFKDGDKILERILYYLPLSDEDETRMLARFTSITRATVKGTLVIGVLQGALAGVAFWVAGIDGAALWGTIMTILSIIPGIGAALVWVPAVIILFVTGHYLTATLLAVWCAGVVGTVDNFLRPVLVGRDAKMPDLLILIGTLGGLFLFGPIGFIVGPIVCGLFLTVWDIYGATFKEVLPPVKSLRP
jgi:predicted PurR-regulated permease PerM